MEGAEGMKQHNPLKGEFINRKQIKASVSIIILFHLVGLIGLCIPSCQVLFLNFVPYHILLMLVIVLVNHYRLDSRLLLFIILVFILGFTGEWAGVHKNWLFGSYTYGKTLGLKLFDVPLIIGVNWFLLVYSAGVLMQRSRVKSIVARVICGAVVLVLLDILIEPVATHFDYWQWANNIIPFKNYACWFLISVLMLSLFELFNFKKQSIVAPVLLLIQFVFFVVLLILNL